MGGSGGLSVWSIYTSSIGPSRGAVHGPARPRQLVTCLKAYIKVTKMGFWAVFGGPKGRPVLCMKTGCLGPNPMQDLAIWGSGPQGVSREAPEGPWF